MVRLEDIESILDEYYYIIPVKVRKNIAKKILLEIEFERTELLNIMFSLDERIAELEKIMTKSSSMAIKYNSSIKPIEKLKRSFEKKYRG